MDLCRVPHIINAFCTFHEYFFLIIYWALFCRRHAAEHLLIKSGCKHKFIIVEYEIFLLISLLLTLDPPDLCLGKNCNNHGSCNQGVCTCTQGYTGDNCQSELKIVVVFIYLHLRLKTQQAQCQAIIYIEDIEDIHTNLIYKNTTVIIHLLYVCKVGKAIKV